MNKYVLHLVVVFVVSMVIALASCFFMLAHLASVVSIAFGSGFAAGMFLGIYLTRLFVKKTQ